jgi:ParB-like chromosome segregation protein Spo0J
LLVGAEFNKFVADVKANNGLHEPITLYQDKVLDGRNRYRACLNAKVEPRYEQFEGDDAAALAFVISKNIRRRHLKPKEKSDVIAALLKETPEKSNRAIGEIVKADKNKVKAVRNELEATGEVAPVEKTVGKDGKARPAKGKRGTPRADNRGIRATLRALDEEALARKSAEPAVPGEELALLREFARFVIGRATVPVDTKDRAEWKALLAQTKVMLGITS